MCIIAYGLRQQLRTLSQWFSNEVCTGVTWEVRYDTHSWAPFLETRWDGQQAGITQGLRATL